MRGVPSPLASHCRGAQDRSLDEPSLPLCFYLKLAGSVGLGSAPTMALRSIHMYKRAIPASSLNSLSCCLVWFGFKKKKKVCFAWSCTALECHQHHWRAL